MPRPLVHAATCTGLAVVAYALTRRRDVVPSIYATGLFVDADHLVDFSIYKTTKQRRGILPLHGWEHATLGWVLAARSSWHPVVLFAALSYTIHLTLDQIFNYPAQWPGYFLTFRALNGFNRQGFDVQGGQMHHWFELPPWQWL
ncbi:MAG: hypothetical protein HY329_00795 [Chloroflexi bacterium]|nr:hypothetical protein [Chloroflexota bacterium]